MTSSSATIDLLNAEILYWKSETDKRKVQLGEYALLDDPCDPNDVLWEHLAVREVNHVRERIAAGEQAIDLLVELVRDKHECLVSGSWFFMVNRPVTCILFLFRPASNLATTPLLVF